MRLVYVHDAQGNEWHRAEWRPGAPVPLRRALCSTVAKTLSASESHESWAHVWARAIDPPGSFCQACDDLARRLGIDEQPQMHARTQDVGVDRMLASIFGDKGLEL